MRTKTRQHVSGVDTHQHFELMTFEESVEAFQQFELMTLDAIIIMRCRSIWLATPLRGSTGALYYLAWTRML